MAVRHEVDVFTLADDAADLARRDALAAYCHRLTVARVYPKVARLRSLPYLLTGTPLTLPYFYSAELAAEVRKAISLRSYDRIFVYCSAMARYVQSVDFIPMVMDLVDVDSDKWVQYADYVKFPFSAVYRREARTLQAYERAACEKASCVLVTTEREAQLARQVAPAARVEVLPNGVDTQYFAPNPEAAPPGPSVIFTGDMSYFPNQEAVIFFARQVLPLVRLEVEDARFLIVGRNPGRKVRELQRIEGVEVTGFVPDVRTWLGKSRVAVAPFTIATGIQNKILEAMAYGLPVVATPRAAQGLSPRVADLVHKGNSAEELASKVIALVRDSGLARGVGLDGRRRVTEDHNWDSVGDRLLHFLEDPVAAEGAALKYPPPHVTSGS